MKRDSQFTERAKEPGFWREIWQQARLVYYLLRDPEVPFYLKFLPFAAFVYVLIPIDFLPDVAPVLGQLDDLTILLVGAKVFIELAPQHVAARHLQAIRTRDGYETVLEGAFAAGGGDPAVDAELAEQIVIDSEHELVVEE